MVGQQIRRVPSASIEKKDSHDSSKGRVPCPTEQQCTWVPMTTCRQLVTAQAPCFIREVFLNTSHLCDFERFDGPCLLSLWDTGISSVQGMPAFVTVTKHFSRKSFGDFFFLTVGLDFSFVFCM